MAKILKNQIKITSPNLSPQQQAEVGREMQAYSELDEILRPYADQFDQADIAYKKGMSVADKEYYLDKDALTLSAGKLRGAKVPKQMILDAIAAADANGVDRADMLALLARESTFTQRDFENEKGTYTKARDSVSGWNLDEAYRPYQLTRFLADKKVPGVAFKKSPHGYLYHLEEPIKVLEYLKANPNLLSQYGEKIKSYSGIPKGFSFYDAAAKQLKTKGVQSYNPGDKNYVNDFNASRTEIVSDPILQEYLNNKQDWPIKREKGVVSPWKANFQPPQKGFGTGGTTGKRSIDQFLLSKQEAQQILSDPEIQALGVTKIKHSKRYQGVVPILSRGNMHLVEVDDEEDIPQYGFGDWLEKTTGKVKTAIKSAANTMVKPAEEANTAPEPKVNFHPWGVVPKNPQNVNSSPNDTVYLDMRTGSLEYEKQFEKAKKNGQYPDYIIQNMHSSHTPTIPVKKNGIWDYIDAGLSAPQRAMVWALTGQYEDPSEALGIENKWAKLAADIVLDPLNLLGVGFATKTLKGLKGVDTAKDITKGLDTAGDLGKGVGGFTDFSKYMKGAQFEKYLKPQDFNKIPEFKNILKESIPTYEKVIKLDKAGASAALINDIIKQDPGASGDYYFWRTFRPHYSDSKIDSGEQKQSGTNLKYTKEISVKEDLNTNKKKGIKPTPFDLEPEAGRIDLILGRAKVPPLGYTFKRTPKGYDNVYLKGKLVGYSIDGKNMIPGEPPEDIKVDPKTGKKLYLVKH
jgi:hypothetical protein